jgi:hypothetical protein
MNGTQESSVWSRFNYRSTTSSLFYRLKGKSRKTDREEMEIMLEPSGVLRSGYRILPPSFE